MRRFAFALAVLAVLVWIGCGNNTPKPVAITLTPKSLSLAPGQQQLIVATITDESGTPLTFESATYTTTSSPIADVSTLGFVCAGTWHTAQSSTPGPCEITGACIPNATAACPATITAAVKDGPTGKVGVLVHLPVDRVDVSPSSACLPVGGTVTLTATATNAGTDITSTVWSPATADSPAVTPFGWVVTPSSVATVDASGATCTTGNTCIITGVADGTATVTAIFQNAPGSSASQNVSSAPTSVEISTCQTNFD